MVQEKYIFYCVKCRHAWYDFKNSKICPKCKILHWNENKRFSKKFIDEIVDVIINLHNSIISSTGGEFGIRNGGGIYFSTYSLLNHKTKNMGKPTKLGAFILNEFAKKHHFIDGNKRTDIYYVKL
jgi:hypothetical protein